MVCGVPWLPVPLAVYCGRFWGKAVLTSNAPQADTGGDLMNEVGCQSRVEDTSRRLLTHCQQDLTPHLLCCFASRGQMGFRVIECFRALHVLQRRPWDMAFLLLLLSLLVTADFLVVVLLSFA